MPKACMLHAESLDMVLSIDNIRVGVNLVFGVLLFGLVVGLCGVFCAGGSFFLGGFLGCFWLVLEGVCVVFGLVCVVFGLVCVVFGLGFWAFCLLHVSTFLIFLTG